VEVQKAFRQLIAVQKDLVLGAQLGLCLHFDGVMLGW